VLVAAYFMWAHSFGPRLAHAPLLQLLADTLIYAALSWGFAAVIAFWTLLVAAVYDLSDGGIRELVHNAIRSSAVAMWFAPAILLLSALTPATFTASLILIVNTTRLLIARWIPARAVGRRTRYALRPFLGAALVAQAALVAILWGYPLLAAALTGAGAAIVTALALLTGASESASMPALPRAFFAVLVTIVLAVGLLPGGGSGQASQPGGAGQPQPPVTSLVPPPDDFAEGPTPADQASAPSAVEVGGGGFPGVILRSRKPPRPVLVPPRTTKAGEGIAHLEPYSIPFSGEYWLFRAPFGRPPARSYTRRDSPLSLSFRTTDGKPMQM
jgi:hypothetical protein